MKYVFGPVPSRRLGHSLGVDTVPLKTCNWNCVYCQLGRSRPVVNERKAYHPTEAILAEIREALAAHEPGDIDWITFVASGEGTLHSEIGRLVRGTKAMSAIPVAVITNGSLLPDPAVREALAAADAVLPSLDAGSDELYRRINRPHPSLTFERHVDGLVAFRDEFAGRLWVEVMLIRDVNDTAEALADLRAVLQRIRPDEVHLVLPSRPPVETWVQPSDEASVDRAAAVLGEIAHIVTPNAGDLEIGRGEDPAEAVAAIVARHPVRRDEVERALARRAGDEGPAVLARLLAAEQVQCVVRNGTEFITAPGAHYPDAAQSARTSPRKSGR